MSIVRNSLIEYTQFYRRLFHAYPEKAWMEYHTVATIARELSSFGFQIKRGAEIMDMSLAMALPSKEENSLVFEKALESISSEELSYFKDNKTALSAFLYLGSEKSIAIRFDMDALAIQESSSINHIPFSKQFSSSIPGVMHSCGHDMHSALGLGLAKLLSENRDKLGVNILLVFQPAEEGVRGAASIVGSKLLDNVDYIISSHMWSNMPTGKIVCSQNGTYSTHKFDVVFRGLSSHAGISPEKGNNALLAAANAVVSLHSLVGEFAELVRVHVGKIEGGMARNIVADYAKIEIELRAKNESTELALVERAKKVISRSAHEQSCSFEIIKQGEAMSAIGSIDFALLIKEAASEISFFNEILLEDNENRGCEDFTSMMNKVISNGGKACFMGVGASLKGKDLSHHTYDFDLSESIIGPVLELYFNIIQKISR